MWSYLYMAVNKPDLKKKRSDYWLLEMEVKGVGSTKELGGGDPKGQTSSYKINVHYDNYN